MRHVLHQATILSRGSAASRAGDNKVGKLPIRKTRTTFGKSRLPESRRQPVREWFLSVYRDPERTTSHRLAGFTECRKNPRFADARRDWRRFRSERSCGLPRAKTAPTPRLVSGSGKSRSPRPGRFAIYSRRKSRCSPSFGQADRMTCRLPAISGVKSPSSPVPALLARLRAAPASRFNWPAKSRHR